MASAPPITEEELKMLENQIPYIATMASAPPITEEELKMLENQIDMFNLAVTTYQLEYVKSELEKIQNDLIKTDITKCDEQCQKANQNIESNTVDDVLKKINDIFNK